MMMVIILILLLRIRVNLSAATYRPLGHGSYARWGGMPPPLVNESRKIRLIWTEESGRILDRQLIDSRSAKVVAILGDKRSEERRFDTMRYWSVMNDDHGRIFLTARFGKGKSASRCMRTALFANCTNALRQIHTNQEPCISWSQLRLVPRVAEKEVDACGENVATNLGLVKTKQNQLIAFGGEAGEGTPRANFIHKQRRHPSQQKTGIAMLQASGSIDHLLTRGWSSTKKDIIQGDANGCIERYFKTSNYTQYLCKYDSQLSLVLQPCCMNQEKTANIRLYARANLNASGGGRSVQTTLISSVSGEQQEPFKLIQFLDGGLYSSKFAAANDIYIFLVNTNPVNPNTFLALFPVVLRASNSAFFALACSLDGVLFSPPWPILQTATFQEGRPYDLPIDGFISSNKLIHFFIHVNVQGIVPSAKAGFPPHLLRLSMRRTALEQYTKQALALLEEHRQKKNSLLPAFLSLSGRTNTAYYEVASEFTERRRRRRRHKIPQ